MGLSKYRFANSYAPSAYRQMARHRGDATIWCRWHRTDQLYFARCTWTFWTQRANTHPSTHGIDFAPFALILFAFNHSVTMKSTIWTISELANEFSITPRTLRFYEDHGIVTPTRQGRNRVYSSRDRARLKLALRGRRLGFQLSEIVYLLDMYAGPDDTEIGRAHDGTPVTWPSRMPSS